MSNHNEGLWDQCQNVWQRNQAQPMIDMQSPAFWKQVIELNHNNGLSCLSKHQPNQETLVHQMSTKDRIYHTITASPLMKLCVPYLKFKGSAIFTKSCMLIKVHKYSYRIYSIKHPGAATFSKMGVIIRTIYKILLPLPSGKPRNLNIGPSYDITLRSLYHVYRMWLAIGPTVIECRMAYCCRDTTKTFGKFNTHIFYHCREWIESWIQHTFKSKANLLVGNSY